MDNYSFLRQLADSWVLLVLVAIFIGVIVFVWRPGSRKHQDEAAESIFENEDHPAPDPNQTSARTPSAKPNEVRDDRP